MDRSRSRRRRRTLLIGLVAACALATGCTRWTEVKRKTIETRDEPVDEPELAGLALSASGTVLADGSLQFELTWTPRCTGEVLRHQRVKLYERGEPRFPRSLWAKTTVRKRTRWVQAREPVEAETRCSRKIEKKASRRDGVVKLRTPWKQLLTADSEGGVVRFRPDWSTSGMSPDDAAAARRRLGRSWQLSDATGDTSFDWTPDAAAVDQMLTALGPVRAGEGDLVIARVELSLSGAKPRLVIEIKNTGKTTARGLRVTTSSSTPGLDDVTLTVPRLRAGDSKTLDTPVNVPATGQIAAIEVILRRGDDDLTSYAGRLQLPEDQGGLGPVASFCKRPIDRATHAELRAKVDASSLDADRKAPYYAALDSCLEVVVHSKVLRPVMSGKKVKITIGAGTRQGVARGWTGVLMAGGSDRPLPGSRFVVLRVSDRQCEAMVPLTLDTVRRNPRVQLTPP